jgi:hypothetical protein
VGKSRFEWPSGAANQIILANSWPLEVAKWLASSFFVLKSKSSFWALSSSPIHPFCSGLLKPNAKKDGSTPWFGVERQTGQWNYRSNEIQNARAFNPV